MTAVSLMRVVLYTEFLHYLSALLQLVWYHISIGVLVLTDIRVVVACST